MKYPQWNEGASDKELIIEFYKELLKKFPELSEDVEYNEGLLHMDMGALQSLAENLCKERNLEKLKDCFDWLNSFFCRSQNELLNAMNVSFLEYFEFNKGLTRDEFQKIMPQQLYRGYVEMMEYMENMAKEANNINSKEKPNK